MLSSQFMLIVWSALYLMSNMLFQDGQDVEVTLLSTL